MLKCIKGNFLFTNAHLIIDEKREYLNGALAINNGFISALMVQSNNLYGDFKDYQQIDLHGQILRPGFIHPLLKYEKTDLPLLRSKLLGLGITSYLAIVKNDVDFKLALNDDFCLGYFSQDYTSSLDKRKYLGDISQDKIIKKDTDIAYIDYDKANILAILNDEQRLKIACLSDTTYLSLLKKTNSRYKLIAYPTNDYAPLKALNNYNQRDILALTTLNILNNFKLNNLSGSLLRGKIADLVCYNTDYKVLFSVKRGKIYL